MTTSAYISFRTFLVCLYYLMMSWRILTHTRSWETYSLSIWVWDIEVAPPSLWARSRRLAAVMGENRKKRRQKEDWVVWTEKSWTGPETLGPWGGAAETPSTAAQPGTTLHTVTMVIIWWDHQDYNSSGINCEINMDTVNAEKQEQRGKCADPIQRFLPFLSHYYYFSLFEISSDHFHFFFSLLPVSVGVISFMNQYDMMNKIKTENALSSCHYSATAWITGEAADYRAPSNDRLIYLHPLPHRLHALPFIRPTTCCCAVSHLGDDMMNVRQAGCLCGLCIIQKSMGTKCGMSHAATQLFKTCIYVLCLLVNIQQCYNQCWTWSQVTSTAWIIHTHRWYYLLITDNILVSA